MKSFSSVAPAGCLAALLLVPAAPVAAQAPAWQSARQVAAATAVAVVTNYSEVTATAVDAAGNVYVAGNFTNTVALGGTTLTSRGAEDVFVAKFSPVSNQFVWAQRAGGPNGDYASALAVSGANVYVAGRFSSITASFGPVTLTNAGDSDVFVAKLADAGPTAGFVWAQRAGGSGFDYAYALAISGANVYIAGSFSSPTARFGSVALTNPNASSSSDVFVAKLADAGPTGGFVWAQRAGGSGSDYATALAVSGANVYVAGGFDSLAADFGPATLANAASITNDVFVAKLADAGSTGGFVWAQRAGGRGYDAAAAMAVSGINVYVAGYFASSTAGFGSIVLTNAAGFSNDVFVAKLTDAGSTGSFAWAQQAGGTGGDEARALAVSGVNVYVAGYFSSSPASFGPVALNRAGFNDVFVAKLTDAGPTGSFAWAQQAGGTEDDKANALVINGANVYVAGDFRSPTASFGTLTVPLAYLGNRPGGFLASLTDPAILATTSADPRVPAALCPNPARGAVTLRLPMGAAPAPLLLSDAHGRVVRRYPAPAGPEATLDLGGLPAGLYLLHGAGPARRLAVE